MQQNNPIPYSPNKAHSREWTPRIYTYLPRRGRACLKQKPKNWTMKKPSKWQVGYGREPFQAMNQIEHRTTTMQHRPSLFVLVRRLVVLVLDRAVIGFKSAQGIDSRGNTGKRCKGPTTFIFSCFNKLGIRGIWELHTVYNSCDYYTQCIIVPQT